MSKLLRDGVPRKENGKIDFTPRRHHAHYALLVLLGFLLPPLAVAARFGIGKDFFLNCFLTICGYIPGHGHNFFIQNIRDNRNRNRTPKWAIRYGLVDTNYLKKREKKRQWTGRYNDQMPERTMYDEEGNEVRYGRDHRFEDGDDAAAASRRREQQRYDGSLVESDRFYNDDGSSSNSLRADRYGGANGSSDPYSLRRSRSNLSGSGVGAAPGAGDAERRGARNKSKSRAFLGRKKTDRHAKSGEVMGDPDYRNGVGAGGYGDGLSNTNSIDDNFGSGGARRYSLDNEGPEDADARFKPSSTAGRAGGYGGSSGSGALESSSASRQGRRANDGLDHTF